MTLTTANTITVTTPEADKLRMTIVPTTGLISGSFIYTGQTRLTPFAGVLFQDQTSGGGYFLGPNGSGKVELTQ